jgi:RNA polymerase primary sigma factor
MSDSIDPLADEMDALSTLLNEGMAQHYLTYDQILEALPEIENNLALLETLLEEAQNLGIAIYESEEDVVAAAMGDSGEAPDGLVVDGEAAAAEALARPIRNQSHDAPLFDLSNVPIDDSVGLYFREMGQQGLLSAEEEVQLAMEIEAGRAATERLRSGVVTDSDELARLLTRRGPTSSAPTPASWSASPRSTAAADCNSWT